MAAKKGGNRHSVYYLFGFFFMVSAENSLSFYIVKLKLMKSILGVKIAFEFLDTVFHFLSMIISFLCHTNLTLLFDFDFVGKFSAGNVSIEEV